MFNIDIGYIDCDHRVVKKAFNKTYGAISGTLRDECDVISPKITVQLTVDKLAKCNYVYIPTFKRFYYITNIISKTSTLTELDLKVDVLMSNPGILNCDCTIDRQEFSYNAYLDDERVMTKYPPVVVTQKFSNTQTIAGDCYILVTAGGWGGGT